MQLYIYDNNRKQGVASIIGIYKIVCMINNKIYIGSSVNMENRMYIHKYKLRIGKHENVHLQRAWKKYSEDNFIFEIIEECSIDILRTREQHWIDTLNVCDINIGYNICPIVGNPKARISEELVMKIKYDLSKGMSVKEIEIKYTVPYTTVNAIRYLNSWDYILPELNDNIISFINAKKPRVDVDTAMMIKIDMSNGIGVEDIQNKYNILYRTALNIRNLVDWRECLFELNEKITNFRKPSVGKDKTLKMLKMRSHCEKCGEVIYKTNNRQKYCDKCK